MALVLNEEQSMLRDSARGLISDKAPVSHLRQLRDAKDATGFSRDLWKVFAEMGFSGLLVPEEFGGSAAQKSEHLPKISDGSLLAALAIDEGAKHRPLQTRMQAVRSGNGFKLK